MKTSNYLLLCFIITTLAGCNIKQKNLDDKFIIGIWQNTANVNSAIEFTENGEYYLRIDGNRLITSDSIVEKFTYNPLLKEKNLKIFRNIKKDMSEGKLVVINPERIKISLIRKETIVSEAEFTKVKQ